MKTLLAIVNTPKESKGFLNYVAGMALDLTAQVKVLAAISPAAHPLGMADTTGYGTIELQRTREKLVKESKEVLNKYVEDINEKISNRVFVDVASEMGFALNTVDELILNNKVQMVVLEGQHDEGFWSQTSSNMDIVKSVKCPVWIIPKGAVYKPFTQIVYATDYKKEDIISLKKLIKTFPHYSPNITALHITDSVDFEERVKKAGFVEMLQKQTAYKPLWVKAVYQNKYDDLTELLNEFALKSKADLLVLLKENKSFFKRIFNTSKTKEILKNTLLPVLIYHEK